MRDPNYRETPIDLVALQLAMERHHLNAPPSKTAPKAPPSNHTSRIVRSSPRTLTTLASLSQDATILLFTPVVIPAGAGKPESDNNTDPFESLGRFVAGYHRKVRHVPYWPKVGLTNTHVAFLEQADVVLVVTCQPSSWTADENIQSQVSFTQEVVEALNDNKALAQRLTTTWIQFAGKDAHDDVPAYDTVVRSENYSLQSGRQVAHLLFKPLRG